jgi:hypothetical protein
MFDITNSRDFYQKLLEDFDDFMGQRDSARHAMNCAITAHHMADWVWGDFVKNGVALKAKLGIKDKNDFTRWIDSQTVWYGPVQGISNGSKHFIREEAKDRLAAATWLSAFMGGGGLAEYAPVDVDRGRDPVLAGFSA